MKFYLDTSKCLGGKREQATGENSDIRLEALMRQPCDVRRGHLCRGQCTRGTRVSRWGTEDRTLRGPGMEEDAQPGCAEEMQADCGCGGGSPEFTQETVWVRAWRWLGHPWGAGTTVTTEVCMRCQWLGLERKERSFFSVSTMGSLQNIQKILKIKTKVSITSASTIWRKSLTYFCTPFQSTLCLCLHISGLLFL